MENKMNCWEILRCGRENGGSKAEQLGVCPAAMEMQCDGLNGGFNAGRICWSVAGTLCGGKKQGTFSEKKLTCLNCNVFKQVKQEEGSQFKIRY